MVAVAHWMARLRRERKRTDDSINLTLQPERLVELIRPALPGRQWYRPRIVWVGCGQAHEAIHLMLHCGGDSAGKMLLCEIVNAQLAIAKEAVANAALCSPMDEIMHLNGWEVTFASDFTALPLANLATFNIFYSFASS